MQIKPTALLAMREASLDQYLINALFLISNQKLEYI